MEGAKRRLLLISAALASAVLWAVGCYDPAYSDGTRCGDGMECPAGRTCQDGFCRLPGGASDAMASGADAADARGGDAGSSRVEVVVRKSSTGGGTVSIGPTSCDTSCVELVSREDRNPVATLRITAFPAPGFYFQRWTGDCTESSRACDVRLDGDRMVQAEFAAITSNLIFISSQRYPGNFGLSGVDRPCQQRAQEAGLTGTWRTLAVADAGGLLARLIHTGDDATTARGFVRMDGQVVADTAEDLVLDHKVRVPILYDELGARTTGHVWTGALANGETSAATCGLWRNSGAGGTYGAANGGGTLTMAGSAGCDLELPVICVMADKKVAAPALPPPPGKLIFTGSAPLLGSTLAAAADSVCAQDRSGAKALIATNQRTAGALLAADDDYFRPDGVFLGTGAEILAGWIRSGIWVDASGAPSPLERVWTGSPAIAAPAGTNCNDWTSGTANGLVGTTTGDALWWHSLETRSCGGAYLVYCVDP